MGKVIMSGIVPQLTVPSAGILAGDISVGSSVYLMENGVAAEYLVVNQGIPSGSSLYDASCDGTWLLRKECYEKRQWNSTNSNNYASSTIHSYLNSTFFNLFGATEQTTIKQVKIPYGAGGGTSTVYSGSNGLITKVFLISDYETGLTTSDWSEYLADGSKLSYFASGNGSDAQSFRVAYLNGSACEWSTRSPNSGSGSYIIGFNISGNSYGRYCQPTDSGYGIRPALILPSAAKFDADTLLLKGAA